MPLAPSYRDRTDATGRQLEAVLAEKQEQLERAQAAEKQLELERAQVLALQEQLELERAQMLVLQEQLELERALMLTPEPGEKRPRDVKALDDARWRLLKSVSGVGVLRRMQ